MSWQTVQLADVADIERKGVDPSIIEPGTNYLGLEHIESGGKIIGRQKVQNGELASTKFQFGPHHVLYGKLRPYLAKIALPDFEGICSTDILPIKPGPKLDRKFLAFYLRQPKLVDFASSRSTGANLPRLSPKALGAFEIPLPSLEEQKRIAAILDQSDNLRRLRERTVEQLDRLGQSVFRDMFGDPIGNERNWEVRNLGSLTVQITSGSTPVGGKKVYVDKGIIFLRSQNVWRRRLELDDVVHIDAATHQKMRKTSLKYGDILITKTGRINTENSSLGRAAMFRGEDGGANINGHVYLVRPKPEVLGDFILYVTTTPEYREYIRSVCVGGIDKRQINKEHLEVFPIIYPPVKDQKNFLNCVSGIEAQKARSLEQLEFFEKLFLSLQQRAFKGEL